jgi:hypothetical protein
MHDTNEEYLRDCVHINEIALNEEYVRIPADLAFWNAKYADAQKAFLLAKLRLETGEAKLYIFHRERMTTGKGPTEAQVDAACKSDPAYEAMRRETIDAEAGMLAIRGTCEAVRTKREMLVSLGATMRAEMQGDPVIRSQMQPR